MRSIYLDYNATTPLDPGAREAMLPFLGPVFGNPSSVHHLGREARAFLDDARDRVAIQWHCRPSEIVFTSGGTESNSLALCGAARLRRDHGRHLITSSVEHHAVLHCLEHLARRENFELTVVEVDAEGMVDPEAVKKALRPDTILVSVMAANNEVGTLQPVAEIGRICRERGVLFHTDAVQWFGKQPVTSIQDFEADLVSVCAHKFHGPKGAGALFIRSPLLPDPIQFGGGQENERRAGTENLAGIAGLVWALEHFVAEPVFNAATLRDRIRPLQSLEDPDQGIVFRGSRENRLANTVAFSVSGCDSMSILAGLDLERVCASSGSACSAGSVTPSHVLRAMGVRPEEASALVRFSLGRENTPEEVNHAAAVFPEVIRRIRSVL